MGNHRATVSKRPAPRFYEIAFWLVLAAGSTGAAVAACSSSQGDSKGSGGSSTTDVTSAGGVSGVGGTSATSTSTETTDETGGTTDTSTTTTAPSCVQTGDTADAAPDCCSTERDVFGVCCEAKGCCAPFNHSQAQGTDCVCATGYTWESMDDGDFRCVPLPACTVPSDLKNCDFGSIYCDYDACCAADHPFYCVLELSPPGKDGCYATQAEASEACGDVCSACKNPPLSCATAPAGGCSGTNELFCGNSTCCPTNSPYYCARTNTCYATQAAAGMNCGNECNHCVQPTHGGCQDDSDCPGECSGDSVFCCPACKTANPNNYCGQFCCDSEGDCF